MNSLVTVVISALMATFTTLYVVKGRHAAEVATLQLRYSTEIAALKASQSEALIAAQDKALKDSERMKDAAKQAIEKAEKQAAVDRASATAAWDAYERLRDQSAATRERLSRVSDEALREYGAAATGLLTQCSREYQQVADKARQLATSVSLLVDAWPEPSKP